MIIVILNNFCRTMVYKILWLSPLLLWILLQVLKYFIAWKKYRNLKRQGVFFNDSQGFSVQTDLKVLDKIREQYLYVFPLTSFVRACAGVKKEDPQPPIFGMVVPGEVLLFVNTCKFLEDIYIK